MLGKVELISKNKNVLRNFENLFQEKSIHNTTLSHVYYKKDFSITDALEKVNIIIFLGGGGTLI